MRQERVQRQRRRARQDDGPSVEQHQDEISRAREAIRRREREQDEETSDD